MPPKLIKGVPYVTLKQAEATYTEMGEAEVKRLRDNAETALRNRYKQRVSEFLSPLGAPSSHPIINPFSGGDNKYLLTKGLQQFANEFPWLMSPKLKGLNTSVDEEFHRLVTINASSTAITCSFSSIRPISRALTERYNRYLKHQCIKHKVSAKVTLAGDESDDHHLLRLELGVWAYATNQGEFSVNLSTKDEQLTGDVLSVPCSALPAMRPLHEYEFRPQMGAGAGCHFAFTFLHQLPDDLSDLGPFMKRTLVDKAEPLTSQSQATILPPESLIVPAIPVYSYLPALSAILRSTLKRMSVYDLKNASPAFS